ncbi:MAG TPA: DUF6057 family protein, partial [Verrucomicrobiae bacterium]|nr:DUF6057 family protein [Verrucomicrobiae bacterium]
LICHAWLKVRWRVLPGWALASAVLYCAGVWPSLLLLVLMGLMELRQKRLVVLALLWAVPLLGAGVCWLWWTELWKWVRFDPGLRGGPEWLAAQCLYLAVPTALVAQKIQVTEAAPHSKKPQRRTPASHIAWYQRTSAAWSLVAIGLFLGWALVWTALALPRKHLAQLEYSVSHGRYERALTIAGELSRGQMDGSAELDLHLALYHTGRLGNELFSYRNQSGWDLLPGLGGGLDTCRAQSRTLFEMGLISESEHLAHEALETEGEKPDLLKRLAEINILKGRPAAARVFLNVLNEVPFWNATAQHLLQNLKTDPQLAADQELGPVRPLMLTNDLAHQAFPAEGLLVQLLRCNPTNQMAFEYLMCQYLVNLEVDKVVNRLWELDNFRYVGIPRHYEEALLLYEQSHGSHIELRGRAVRPETAERFRRFNEAMNQRQFATQDGRRQLAEQFGDTYWYFYFARRNPSPQS